MNNSLLPPNSSALEIDMAEAISRVSNVPIPNRDLYNPDLCPAALLPWLAWSLSVDEWDSNATEAEKRGIIRNSLYVHKHKGTLASLKRAVEPLGYEVDIVEWYNDTPMGLPYTFRLEISVPDRGITDAIYDQMLVVVNAYKNVRSHMLSMSLIGRIQGNIYLGAACMSGVVTAVYPYIAEDLQSIATLKFGAAEQSFDFVSIYPNP